MRRPLTLHRALRFAAVVAIVGPLALAAFGAGCGGNDIELWTCLNPATGKEDPNIGDPNHFVNGQRDPCHCFDPCGPAETCPILVDAGPPGPGCDGGSGGP